MNNVEAEITNKREADEREEEEKEEIKDKKDLVQTYLVVSTLLLAIKQFTATPEFNITNIQNSTLTTLTYSTSDATNTGFYTSFYLFTMFVLLYRATLSNQLDFQRLILINSQAILIAIGFTGIIYFSIGNILISLLTEDLPKIVLMILNIPMALFTTLTLGIKLQETIIKVILIMKNNLILIERKVGYPVMILGVVAFFGIALRLLVYS